MFRLRVKGDYIQFAVIATPCPRADMYVLPDEIALVFVLLSGQLFEEVRHSHLNILPTSTLGTIVSKPLVSEPLNAEESPETVLIIIGGVVSASHNSRIATFC